MHQRMTRRMGLEVTARMRMTMTTTRMRTSCLRGARGGAGLRQPQYPGLGVRSLCNGTWRGAHASTAASTTKVGLERRRRSAESCKSACSAASRSVGRRARRRRTRSARRAPERSATSAAAPAPAARSARAATRLPEARARSESGAIRRVPAAATLSKRRSQRRRRTYRSRGYSTRRWLRARRPRRGPQEARSSATARVGRSGTRRSSCAKPRRRRSARRRGRRATARRGEPR
mmetsp:Transcript_8647/g.28507  ORF Transcript_8647/g.28507 Transcript_8647/m.28507 type:complete len:233 (+) Transcript_8647:285-983(+)